jgi:DNA-binding LacI/PurR family transcriptional regulator
MAEKTQDLANDLKTWHPDSRELLCQKINTFTEQHEINRFYRAIVKVLLDACRRSPDERIEKTKLEDLVENELNERPGDIYQLIDRVKKGVLQDVSSLLSIQIGVDKAPYGLIVSGQPPEVWSQVTKAKAVGVLVANGADWFTGRLVAGMAINLRHQGFDLLVEFSNDSPRDEEIRIRDLARKCKGLLVVPVSNRLGPTSVEVLQDFPCVLVDRYIIALPTIPSVHHDDYTAGRAVGRYLKANGCKRVIVVHQRSPLRPSQHLTPLIDRAAGCLAEMDAEMDVLETAPLGAEEHGGVEALRKLHSEFPLDPNDGIFATTDKVAAGCRYFIASLPEGSRPRPENIIGFEGQPFGAFLQPPLTSVRAEPAVLGQLAARILLARMGIIKLRAAFEYTHFALQPTFLLAEHGTRFARDLATIVHDSNSRNPEAYYAKWTGPQEKTLVVNNLEDPAVKEDPPEPTPKPNAPNAGPD